MSAKPKPRAVKADPVAHVRWKKITPKSVPFDVYERDVKAAEDAGAAHATRYHESLLPEKLEAARWQARMDCMAEQDRKTLDDVDRARVTVERAAAILRVLARCNENGDLLLADTASGAADLLDDAAADLHLYLHTQEEERKAEAQP